MPKPIQVGLEPEPFIRASTTQWLLAGGAFLVFLFLSIAHSFTRCPWWDEGVFADIALNFRNFGHLGSTVLDPNSWLELPGVHRYTYWQFPLYTMTVGSWFRLVPVTAFWMRMLSVLFGCIFVFSWFVVIRSISHDEPLALLVASVVAVDYVSVLKASDGRMDTMCVALGLAALASYFWLRESNWSLGVVLASWFGAASLLCHPMGLVTNAWLAAMMLLDWQRIRWGALVAAAIPYLIGLAGCAYYIHQAPDIFAAQSKAASGYRVSGWGAILANILNDGYKRYFKYYYGGYSGLTKLKLAALVFPVAGVAGVLADGTIRSQALGKRLLLLAGLTYVGVALIDNQKFGNYIILFIPILNACGAIWIYARWKQGGWRRVVPCCLLTVSVAGTLGGVGYKIYKNEYRNLYDPTIAAVQSSLPPGGIVMGGSELGFALGFGLPLIDDRFMGFFSGNIPDVFVVNKYYELPARPSHSLLLKRAFDLRQSALQTQYHLILSNQEFSVYVRNAALNRNLRTN